MIRDLILLVRMKNQILESLSLSTIEKLQEYLIAQNIEKHKNTVELFQRFIRTKLDLFLEKHFQIEYKGQHRLYALTSNYNDILMLFAYRQAFSLPYDVINRDWINKYHKNNISDKDLFHDLHYKFHSFYESLLIKTQVFLIF